MYKEKSLNKLCNQQLKQMYKEKGDKRGIPGKWKYDICMKK